MMKLKSKIKIAAVFMLAAVIFSACGAAAPAEPTQDPNAIFTQVAETVMVSMTQTSEASPPTPMPGLTATMEPTLAVTPTDTLPTQPPGPTLPPGPTATIPRVGDSAKFNTQTPADGTVLKPSEDFQFIVCLGNNGTTEWDSSYYLEWVSGYQLWNNQTKFYVGETIEPGGKWCFYSPAVAPPNPGPYTTRWYMRNGGGDFMLEVYFNYKVEA